MARRSKAAILAGLGAAMLAMTVPASANLQMMEDGGDNVHTFCSHVGGPLWACVETHTNDSGKTTSARFYLDVDWG